MAKRETTKERCANEEQRRKIRGIARQIAGEIRTKRHRENLSARERELFDYVDKVFHGITCPDLMDAKWIKSESIENIAESLRLAADMLEEKPMDGRSLSGHDRKIEVAWLTASRGLWRADPVRGKPLYEDESSRIVQLPYPTFSEFLEAYREQNPKVKVEERSLRRSLKRLGFSTVPDKRGRPKE